MQVLLCIIKLVFLESFFVRVCDRGGVPEFTPFIRFHTFNNFSIDFTVILRCKEFVDNYLIKHEFIKRLHKRYAKEGIVIPYPIRAINYSQEGVEGK